MISNEESNIMSIMLPNGVLPKGQVRACPQCNKTLVVWEKKTEQWKCWNCKIYFAEPITRMALGGQKKDPSTIPIPSRKELINKIHIVPNLMYRAFISLLYLTGSRISEIVGNKGHRDILPLRKYQFEFKENSYLQEVLLVNNIPILKRRKKVTKNVPIIVDKEPELSKHITDYLNTLEENDILFPFTREHGWKIITKHLDKEYFPHFLRHTRVTRLVVDENLNDIEITRLIGWKNRNQLLNYDHLRWTDLADKLGQ